jgi:hypothetical protein
LEPSLSLATARPNGPKEIQRSLVGGIKRRMISAERRTGKRARESWKRTQSEEGGGRKGGIYGRRESSEARVRRAFPDRRLLNLGGGAAQLRLYTIKEFYF